MLDSDQLRQFDVEPSSTVYVADRELNLVCTNLSWRDFATKNNGEKLLGKESKPNLLKNMTTEQAERWRMIYRLLLDGRLSSHRERFICSSPSEKRNYELLITPHRNDEGEVAWLIHQTVRVDEQKKPPLKQKLKALDESMDHVDREYRSRILLCNVRVPGYKSSLRQQPLERLGGDLIWCRRLSGDVTDLVHADVAGHGADAAKQATKIVTILDEIASPERSIPDVLSALNQALLDNNPEDRADFATGLYFRFDNRQTKLQCVNFGHLRPLFSRSGPVHLESGYPIGIIENVDPWPLSVIDPKEHGSRFLIYSDGITEQFDSEGEMFGIDRLWHSFHENEKCPLNEILAVVHQDIEQFRGEAIVKDDRTMLALELGAQ